MKNKKEHRAPNLIELRYRREARNKLFYQSIDTFILIVLIITLAFGLCTLLEYIFCGVQA